MYTQITAVADEDSPRWQAASNRARACLQLKPGGPGREHRERRTNIGVHIARQKARPVGEQHDPHKRQQAERQRRGAQQARGR